MTTELKPYSVMLEYPDYMEGGTYYAHVSARSVKEAVHGARDMCMKENWSPYDQCSLIHSHFDLFVLLVIAGHHDDLNLGE